MRSEQKEGTREEQVLGIMERIHSKNRYLEEKEKLGNQESSQQNYYMNREEGETRKKGRKIERKIRDNGKVPYNKEP